MITLNEEHIKYNDYWVHDRTLKIHATLCIKGYEKELILPYFQKRPINIDCKAYKGKFRIASIALVSGEDTTIDVVSVALEVVEGRPVETIK